MRQLSTALWFPGLALLTTLQPRWPNGDPFNLLLSRTSPTARDFNLSTKPGEPASPARASYVSEAAVNRFNLFATSFDYGSL
jgi:hypothetical protein